MKYLNRSFTEGPLFANIVIYTIPIILTGILQLLFNAADLVVVGRFCGSVSVAAVGATSSLTSLFVNTFIGLSVGAGVVVARSSGAYDDEAVHKTVHTALPAALICGVVLTVLGVSLSTPILRLMDTPENVLGLSSIYMRIYFCGMTFNMVYNFTASILRAVGDTRSPLLFLTLAGIVNVILNVVFVTVLHMNVAGVALATTISQAISAVLVVRTLMRRTDACRLYISKMRIYKKQLLSIVRIGLPAGIQSSLFNISNVMIQSSINSFGDVVMSGNAAAQNIEGFVYTTLNSFYQTTVNYVGQNAGARKYKRILKVVGLCCLCSAVLVFTISVLIIAFDEQLLSIYITDSVEAISRGADRLAIVCFLYFLCGIMEISTGALRGLGASFTPMLLSIFGVCIIRLGWIFAIFPIERFHTPFWLYMSYPVSWIVTLIAQLIAFFIVFRKQLKLNPPDTELEDK